MGNGLEGMFMDQSNTAPRNWGGLMSMFQLQDEKEWERQLELRRLMRLHQNHNPKMKNRDAYMQSARHLLDQDLNTALFSRALQQNNRQMRMTY